MRNKTSYILYLLLCSFMLSTMACKSGKFTCPAYGGGGGASAGMPKSTKTKSGVFPPGKK